LQYIKKSVISLEKDTYKTIEVSVGEALYKEKGSKFIGFAFPILSEDEAKMHIQELKKKHHAARHWCYAWQLGIKKKQYRVNDDGEPSNTAGQPIYGQILAKDVTNILVVVVRYFGGTKLGVGGLMTAYKTAAKLILDEANIIIKTINISFKLNFEYADMNKVMKIIKDQNLKILKQQMELNCEFVVEVREREAAKVEQLFKDLRCLQIKKL
jgi:uncharacterized YigZ family protein